MNYAQSILRGAARKARRWMPAAARPAILMYHRIGNDHFDPWGLCVRQEKFEQQLEWLHRNRIILPLEEFAERHLKGKLDSAAIALTFDDGYASTLHAIPVVEGLDLHGTIFLPVELIGQRRRFWWDELAAIVIHSTSERMRVDEADVIVPSPDARDTVWLPHAPPRTKRQKLFQDLWSTLRTKTSEQIEQVMANLRTEAPPPSEKDRPLLPDEVKSISSETIHFGSHALTHPYFPALDDETKAHEIHDSVAKCAALTGRRPSSFSYPYGDLDRSSVRLVREAGFECACATGNAFVSERSDPFALPRQYVGDWDAARLADMLGAS